MLGLDTRRLLLDALRPPAGHRLDVAVGTTFTLDLTALLAVPLATALRDGREDGADDRVEALDLFETMSRVAGRVVVLAQAGMTAVPEKYRPLYACIEDSVVHVRRPRPGRIFHPKLWALRFRADDSETHHRVVVLTRNLTFDRTWDVMVVADQDDAVERTFDTTGLLGALRSAPALVESPGDKARQLGLLSDLVGTLETARFPLQDGATGGAFVPLGWGGTSSPWPFEEQCRNALVVSPFLGAKAAERFLRSATHGSTAVARPTAFDDVVDAIPAKVRCLVPRPEAEPDSEDGAPTSLRGLHAKVYVQDQWGGPYRMWLGSANLTDAAFAGNVEMLVRVEGPPHLFSKDAVLGTGNRRDRAQALVDMLTEYAPAEATDESSSDSALQQAGIDVAGGGARISVTSAGDELWDVSLSVPVAPPGLTLDARLLTLPSALPVVDGGTHWTGLATTSITPFVVLGLSDGVDRHHLLVRAHLDGDPAHRRSAVLASCMTSPEDFLRYVLALLGEDDPTAGEAGAAAWERTALGAWLDPERVLEGLLIAASRSPQRLEHLARLIRELDRSEKGRAVVPDEFRGVWDPVWTAVAESVEQAEGVS